MDVQTVAVAETLPLAVVNADDEKMRALGYEPQLNRTFSLFSSVGICMAIIGCTPSITVSLANGLASGGPVAIVYGWILSVMMGLCIAASMGEIASGFPLAGALYNYSAALAPPRYRLAICFFTGWMNLLGQLAITIAVVYASAELVIAMAVIGSDFTYTPPAIHTVAIYWAILILHFFTNLLPTRTLSIANKADVVLLAAGTLVIITVLLSVNDNKNSASFVFTTFNNGTGWGSNGLAWLLGLLQSCYTLTGYDAAGHMSEETHRSDRTAPLGMVLGVGFSGLVGLVYIIPLLFSVGDIDSVLKTKTGLPAAQIFYNVAGKRGSLGLLFLVFMMQYLCGLASVTASSRMCWAFSRDDALPGSKYLKRVWQKNHIPVYAMAFCVSIEFVVGCIAIGSTTAFFAFTSVTTIALYISYVIPTLLLNVGGRARFVPGPFTLGKWSAPIGWTAIAWVALTSGLFVMPNYFRPTATNMNYASAMMGLYFICCGFYWVYKRKTFEGPNGSMAQQKSSITVSQYKNVLAANPALAVEPK